MNNNTDFPFTLNMPVSALAGFADHPQSPVHYDFFQRVKSGFESEKECTLPLSYCRIFQKSVTSCELSSKIWTLVIYGSNMALEHPKD